MEKENESRAIKVKVKHPLPGPNFKRQYKDDSQQYKYVAPVKEFPAKYKETKIRIVQDVTAHDHHKKHPLNILFNQYNDFVKLVFKNKTDKTID